MRRWCAAAPTVSAAGGLPDHRACEHRPSPGLPWRIADARTDAPHRAALGLAFDPAHLPEGRFLTADCT